MKGRVLLVALALSFLGLTAMAEGATFNVSTEAEFQNALNTAASNGEDDTINVQADMNITFTLTYLTDDGDGGHTLTINGNGYSLNGGNSVQIMNIDTDISGNGGDANGHVEIDNLTFQNGNSSGEGGGLYIRTGEANITLTSNTFSNNTATNYGGGAYVETQSGTIDLTNNTFSSNTADYGGGARVWTDSGTIDLTGNTFSNNTATKLGGGAAMWTYSGTITITGNTFSGNNAGDWGGGAFVYTQSGTIDLTGNTFSSNTGANSGGGAFVETYSSGTIDLTNNTFSNNTADWGGGALVYLEDDTATANIYNNIIYGNTANAGGNDGDDLYVVSDENGNGTGSPVNLYNNDLSCNNFDGLSTCLVVTDTDQYTQGSNISQDPYLWVHQQVIFIFRQAHHV